MTVLIQHLHDLYSFYGEYSGVRIARKHIAWYTKGLVGSASFRQRMNQLQTCEEQLSETDRFFIQLSDYNQHLHYIEEEKAIAV